MSLARHPLHESALLRVCRVCCRPHETACGGVEHSKVNALAFPLNGVFVKHHEGGPEVVAHAGQTLFFDADEAYRVSHPAGGGDECLVFEWSDRTLRELIAQRDPSVADAPRASFPATHAALAAATLLQQRLLWQRLRDGRGGALEIEERSLALCAAALAEARPGMPRTQDRRPRVRQRRREQACTTAVALAAHPEAPWTLEGVARDVHASPFHLARSFREEFGESIHQYLLRARLAQAVGKVLDSDEPLTRLAMTLGFATPSHFTAAFRARYGVTPSALRRGGRPASARELRTISTATRDRAR
ncbi:MAG: helix-turn-helix transcriptional regulator [Lysobacterales bacterium]